MKKLTVSILVLACSVIGMAGCSFPTEQASVIDNRPTISFKGEEAINSSMVFVDGVAVGKVSQFKAPNAGLRVLPGTHVISVQKADGSKTTQRIYVADGVTKTLIVQ